MADFFTDSDSENGADMDLEGVDFDFTLKNLAAEEFRMRTGPHLRTLNDLRTVVESSPRYGQVPREFQGYVYDGRSYDHQFDGNTTLSQIFQGSREGPNQERMMWLVWYRDQDYICCYRGGMMLDTEYDNKRRRQEAMGRPFEAITIRAWKQLHGRWKVRALPQAPE